MAGGTAAGPGEWGTAGTEACGVRLERGGGLKPASSRGSRATSRLRSDVLASLSARTEASSRLSPYGVAALLCVQRCPFSAKVLLSGDTEVRGQVTRFSVKHSTHHSDSLVKPLLEQLGTLEVD